MLDAAHHRREPRDKASTLFVKEPRPLRIVWHDVDSLTLKALDTFPKILGDHGTGLRVGGSRITCTLIGSQPAPR